MSSTHVEYEATSRVLFIWQVKGVLNILRYFLLGRKFLKVVIIEFQFNFYSFSSNYTLAFPDRQKKIFYL